MNDPWKFELVAGLFIRNQIRKELEKVLFKHTDSYSIKEIKGIFESTFLIEFEKGNEKEGAAIYQSIKKWVESVNNT